MRGSASAPGGSGATLGGGGMTAYATEVVNLVPFGSGVRLVCEFCGRLSGRRASGGLADLPNGWSMAPFRADYERADGSMGASYRCPPCADRRDFPITPREYMRPCAIDAGGRCATHPGGCPPHVEEPTAGTTPTDRPSLPREGAQRVKFVIGDKVRITSGFIGANRIGTITHIHGDTHIVEFTAPTLILDPSGPQERKRLPYASSELAPPLSEPGAEGR